MPSLVGYKSQKISDTLPKTSQQCFHSRTIFEFVKKCCVFRLLERKRVLQENLQRAREQLQERQQKRQELQNQVREKTTFLKALWIIPWLMKFYVSSLQLVFQWFQELDINGGETSDNAGHIFRQGWRANKTLQLLQISYNKLRNTNILIDSFHFYTIHIKINTI